MLASFSMLVCSVVGILVLKMRYLFFYTYDLVICVQSAPFDIGLIVLANIMKPQELPIRIELFLIFSFVDSDSNNVPKDMTVYESNIPRQTLSDDFIEEAYENDIDAKSIINDTKTPVVVIYPSEKDSIEKSYMIGYRIFEEEAVSCN